MPEHTIAENLTRLQNAKTAIGAAITAKGGTVAASDGLEEFAADIATITNQYTSGDEGKVVSNGALVSQTSTTATANGTINTTTNNEVVVNVPNTYTAGDEGKVVSNGALVAQTAHAAITTNGTYDTTLNNSVTVNVPEGGKIVPLTAQGYTGAQKVFLVYDSTNIFITGTLQNGNLNRTVIFEYTDNITPPGTTFNNVVMLGDGTKYTSCSINTLNKQITMQIYSFSGSAGGVYYFSPIAAN